MFTIVFYRKAHTAQVQEQSQIGVMLIEMPEISIYQQYKKLTKLQHVRAVNINKGTVRRIFNAAILVLRGPVTGPYLPEPYLPERIVSPGCNLPETIRIEQWWTKCLNIHLVLG